MLLPRAGRELRGTVMAGRYPEGEVSRLTIRTYRVSRDSDEPDGQVRERTVTSRHDRERLPNVHEWPPCRCPRCRTGPDPAPR
ncbi:MULTISPECIES: hypothetical protein [Streptomyces]|uniref:Uncharacterized protein n=1 Tax=Streptomyces sp. 900129855 TaxID=3155129 RepID=A0ABV2ZGC8_9ACTN